MNLSESTVSGIPDYVLKRAMKPWPSYARHLITPLSTCVTSFGDPRKSVFASIGINPTTGEFPISDKRLCDYDVLGRPKESGSALSEAEAIRVIDYCHSYFERNVQTSFFHSNQRLVLSNIWDGLRYGENATHLDLVQWSTQKLWSKLYKEDQIEAKRLLMDDMDFLISQIKMSDFKLLFLNGASVITALSNYLEDVKPLYESESIGTGELKSKSKMQITVGTVFGTPFVSSNQFIGKQTYADIGLLASHLASVGKLFF